MTQATIHEAKTHLSRLIQKALAGEEIIIAKRDQPLVRLQVVAKSRASRIGGLKHWRKEAGPDFDDPKLDRKIERDFLREDPVDPLSRK